MATHDLQSSDIDARYMKRALVLARRGSGCTSPNPMVGAVLVREGKILGEGWHRQAGMPHAEIEAMRDAALRNESTQGATLYVTLEPCCTHGRTPPCTAAILRAGVRRLVVGAIDPNPDHAGRGIEQLRRAGLDVRTGILELECARLINVFSHWMLNRRPFVTLKAGMTLDGKIATAGGQSKWITSERARGESMRLRHAADAILVGVETVLADDPSLTLRPAAGFQRFRPKPRPLLRIVLDSRGRTPSGAQVCNDAASGSTRVVVTRQASAANVARLKRRVEIWIAPTRGGRVDLGWVLRRLAKAEVQHLLVEGGGRVHAGFLEAGLADAVAFFYAPKILGGRDARKGVAGVGISEKAKAWRLVDPVWRRLGDEVYLRSRIQRGGVEENRGTA